VRPWPAAFGPIADSVRSAERHLRDAEASTPGYQNIDASVIEKLLKVQMKKISQGRHGCSEDPEVPSPLPVGASSPKLEPSPTASPDCAQKRVA